MTAQGTARERLLVLCRRLVEATDFRQIEWQLTETDVYVWADDQGSVSITSRDHDGEPPYELKVLNAAGETLDELASDLVGDDMPAPWNQPLADLYRIARRSALRADDIIDALIARLPQTEADRAPQRTPTTT